MSAHDNKAGDCNPVRMFFETFRDEFKWDLLPFSFLYDLYRSWFERACASSRLRPLGRTTFIHELCDVLSGDREWDADTPTVPFVVGNRMNIPEPLVKKYKLSSWDCIDEDHPTAARLHQYRGLRRRSTVKYRQATARVTERQEVRG